MFNNYSIINHFWHIKCYTYGIQSWYLDLFREIDLKFPLFLNNDLRILRLTFWHLCYSKLQLHKTQLNTKLDLCRVYEFRTFSPLLKRVFTTLLNVGVRLLLLQLLLLTLFLIFWVAFYFIFNC